MGLQGFTYEQFLVEAKPRLKAERKRLKKDKRQERKQERLAMEREEKETTKPLDYYLPMELTNETSRLYTD